MSRKLGEKNRKLLVELYEAMLALRQTATPSEAQTERLLRVRDRLCETVEACELFRAISAGS